MRLIFSLFCEAVDRLKRVSWQGLSRSGWEAEQGFEAEFSMIAWRSI